MHAYCINGGTKEERERKISSYCNLWRAHAIDMVLVNPTEDPSIGIGEVRTFIHRLSMAPTASTFVVGIIHGAHRLTGEAQQALLKSLEEPPPRVKIILETEHAQALSSTVLSRCQMIDMPSQTDPDSDHQQFVRRFEELDRIPAGKKLAAIDTIGKTREEAAAWIEQSILALDDALRSYAGQPTKIAQWLRRLLQSRELLAKNISPKLVLDAIFLTNSLDTASHVV